MTSPITSSRILLLSLIALLFLSGCGLGIEGNPTNGGKNEQKDDPITISATPAPASGGTVAGAGDYNPGDTVTLTATPEAGYRFIGWEENGQSAGTDALLTFTAGEARELIARFEPIRHTIDVNIQGSGLVQPGEPVTVGHGETLDYLLTPDAGYDIGDISGCPGQLDGNLYTLDPVLTDCTLTIAFAQRSPEDPGASPPDDGGTAEDEPPASPVASLTDQLRELGLNVDETLSSPRRMNDTLELDDLPPLGTEVRLAPRELFLLGQTRGQQERPVSTFLEIYDETVGEIQPKGTLVRYEDEIKPYFIGSIPDGSGIHPGSQFGRDAAAGDFDGDGRQEVVYFHTWPNPSAKPVSKYNLSAILVEDDTEYTAPEELIPLGQLGLGPADKIVRDLKVVAGEMNGDDKDDALVVFLKDAWFGLMLIPGQGSNRFDLLSGPGKNPILLDPTDGTRSIEVAQGNLDTDAPLETVVLLRTWNRVPDGGETSGSAHYYIFDDFSDEPYKTQLIAEGELRLPAYIGSGSVSPVTAGLAIADFDGDSLDEIAFAGLTRMRYQDCQENHYGVLVLDNLTNGLKPLERHSFAATAPDCAYIYEAMVHPLQIDKDFRKELLLNEHIIDFDTPDKLPAASTPAIKFFEKEPFSRYTYALATADVNGDGLDEVIGYTLYDAVLRLRGNLDPEAAEGIGAGNDDSSLPSIFSEDVAYTSGSPDWNPGPLILPYDNDDDGQLLRYVPGSHTVTLSAPIIHAVLAVPPCSEALGQDMNDCSTTSGSDNTTGQEASSTITTSVSAGVGLVASYGIGPFTFETSFTASLEKWASQTMGTGYELTYSLDYTTYGQDAVLFSSVPYDIYQYEVLQSARDPDLAGQTIAFMYPRRPVTRLVSVDYYNARVPPGGLRIGPNILGHSAGDIGSYLDLEEKNALRSTVMARDANNPHAFLEHGPINVGGENTDVTLSVSLSETTFAEQSFGLSTEFSLETTAGIYIRNFSVGMENSNAMSVSLSNTSRFSGTVPGITDDSQVYSFGIFTYMGQAVANPEDAPQRFQVINYWVQ